MVRKQARTLAHRFRFSLAAIAAAAALSGCPPTYDVETGDWVFHLSYFPMEITHGLTLHPDGSATPYEAVPGYGAFPGDWTWQTNGQQIWFYQNVNGDEYTYGGTLLSEVAAYGNIYQARSRNPIGQWEAVHDD